MRLLALDVGSSSVKAAVLAGDGPPRGVARVPFATRHDDAGDAPRATVRLIAIDAAIRKAIAALGPAARRVDLIAHATMGPSWVALDARGRPLTDVVTHQDRRATREAAEIERRVGRARHLRVAGNRPFPGGISSTTWAWHLAHDPAALRRASLVGHLGTWLAFALTGARAVDRGHAGFTGLMDVRRFAYDDALVAAVGVDRAQLPPIVESDAIVGRATARAARRFGVAEGTPVLAGCLDGSGPMFAAGGRAPPRAGQLVNVCGSTDVLALLAAEPRPHADVLTRPLGVGDRWLSVATIAAAGTAIAWAGRTLFSEMSEPRYYAHVARLMRSPPPRPRVAFDGDLAGSRTAMDVARAAVTGLTLSTTRDELLAALVAGLAARGRARLAAFATLGLPVGRDVFVTGGAAPTIGRLMRARWPAGFRFREAGEATLVGLYALARTAR